MAGALVASQFLAAQNWALGSAMAVVLIAMIMLASSLIAAVVAFVVRALIRKSRNVRIDDGSAPVTVAVRRDGRPGHRGPAVDARTGSPSRRRSRPRLPQLRARPVERCWYTSSCSCRSCSSSPTPSTAARAFLVWQGFSTEPYSDLWTTRRSRRDLANSFKIADRQHASSRPSSVGSPAWRWLDAAASGPSRSCSSCSSSS